MAEQITIFAVGIASPVKEGSMVNYCKTICF